MASTSYDWTEFVLADIQPSKAVLTKQAIYNLEVTFSEGATRGASEFSHILCNDKLVFEKERALWCPETTSKEPREGLKTKYCVFYGKSAYKEGNSMKLKVRALEMLPIVDTAVKNGFRNFLVKCGTHKFYVNVALLMDYEGIVFESWKKNQDEGLEEAVIPDDPSVRNFLNSFLRYDKLLIHSGNWLDVCQHASFVKSTKILRAVEQFLIDLKTMHPMKKLEIAADLKFSRLFMQARTELGRPPVANRTMMDYAHETGFSLDHIHPTVQKLRIVTPDYLVYL
ncbi:unnamed protein product, partial [Mesorhabditis spiculigera]